MIRALLLDLDDTLLHNHMDDFLPRYFQAVTAAVADLITPEEFLAALREATQAMMANTDPERTNADVFWQVFPSLVDVPTEPLDERIDRFYSEVFPTLNSHTAPMPGAREVVAEAQRRDWHVVVATNPVFPMQAIRSRLAWAGLEDVSFDLVTAYENMHATKPHPEYYREIASRLDVAPHDAVMAGNHLANDLVPAAAVGMRTFWVDTYGIADADFTPDASGDLNDLRTWLYEIAGPSP